MTALKTVSVPDIGDFKDIPVIEVLVKVGDTVAAEDSLLVLESDKATMEVPAPFAGVVQEILVQVGDKVSQGHPVFTLAPMAEASKTAVAPTAPIAPAAPLVNDAPTLYEVVVPDLGGFKDIPVIEVLVKLGQGVQAEDSLVMLESDKATMEVPTAVAGVVQALHVQVGDKVSTGQVIATLTRSPVLASLNTSSIAVPTPATTSTVPNLPAPPAELTQPAPAQPSSVVRGRLPHASPSIRRFARELGVDLQHVVGSGPKGRILQNDVQQYVKGELTKPRTDAHATATANGGLASLGLLPWPQVDFAKFGAIESKPLSRIKKISGANLHRNWVMIPHVTQFDEADITELEQFRQQSNKRGEKEGVKVTMLAFLIKAVVASLKAYPEFNSSLDGDNLILKQYWHIGFAADTPNGLMVPVLKDADKKGVLAIAREMTALSQQAREGKLKPADMQGATFTLSSLGGIGGTAFTPIINAPEVAILGVSKSQTKPLWDGSTFNPRLMLPLSLSYDHRVIDGALAARFTTHLATVLADIRQLIL